MVARGVAAWQQAGGYVASVGGAECRMMEAARTSALGDKHGLAHRRRLGLVTSLRCTLTDLCVAIGNPSPSSRSQLMVVCSSTGVSGYIAGKRGYFGRGSFDWGLHVISSTAGIQAIGDRAEDFDGHAAQHLRIESERRNMKQRTSSGTAMEGTFVGCGGARLPAGKRAGGPAGASQDRVAQGYTAVDFCVAIGNPSPSSGSTMLVLEYRLRGVS